MLRVALREPINTRGVTALITGTCNAAHLGQTSLPTLLEQIMMLVAMDTTQHTKHKPYLFDRLDVNSLLQI